MADQTKARRARLSQSEATIRAHHALDLLLQTGFCSFEAGLTAVEARLERSTEARRMSTRDWIDLIRAESGTDTASIQAMRPAWLPPVFCVLESPSLPCGCGRGDWHVCIHGPLAWSQEHNALCAARRVLKAERRCSAPDGYRAYRIESEHAKRPGYDLTNAFDRYVLLLATLTNTLGVCVKGIDSSKVAR